MHLNKFSSQYPIINSLHVLCGDLLLLKPSDNSFDAQILVIIDAI